MARVGQFKALGSALGGYKKTLADVQSKDYAKKYADVQAQEAVSLYNEIGGTVANIIGIAKEKKLLKEIGPLDKPERPDVPIESQSPDALEGVDIVKGKEVDFSPDLTIDDTLQMAGPRSDVVGSIDPAPSQMMPRAGLDTLIQESQSGTGMTNAEKQFKVLDETKELYEQTLSSDDKAFNAMSTSQDQFKVLDDTRLLYEQTLRAADDKNSNNIASLEEKKNVPGGEFEGFLGSTGERIQQQDAGKFYDFDSNTWIDRDYLTPEAREGRVKSMAAGATMPKREEYMDEYGRLDPFTEQYFTENEKLSRRLQSYKERNNIAAIGKSGKPIKYAKDSMTDDMVMDSISDTSLGDFNFSKENVIKQARAVGGDRADELEMVFGMESSFGQDPNAKGNILQIKNASLRQEAQDAGIDFSNPSQVSKFYMEKTNEFTKDFNNYSVQSGSLAGKNINVYSEMNKAGLDKKGVNYLTWQQGRMGVLDMVTALKTGNLGKETRSNMLNNVSEQQRKNLLKKKDTKQFIRTYLNIQSTKMKGYKS